MHLHHTDDSSDFEAVRRVKSQYFRYIDTKRWDDLRSIFTDDATFAGLWAAAEGPDGFIGNIARNLTESVVTVHQGFMPELQRMADGSIRGIWAMYDYLTWPAGTRGYLGVGLPGQRGIRGYGHYEDEYRLDNGQWKISSLRLSRIRIDPILDEEPASVEYPFVRLTDDWLTHAPGPILQAEKGLHLASEVQA